MKRTLKLQYGSVIRRFPLLSSPPSMEEVHEVVEKLFEMKKEKYVLSYLDDEGDKILVCSDGELGEAVVLCGSSSVIRLTLERKEEEKEEKEKKKEKKKGKEREKTWAELEIDDIDLFNRSPEKGIKRLILKGVVDETPDSIALFLKECHYLDKSSIGSYLGSRHPFPSSLPPSSILLSFIALLDFSRDTFIHALRRLLLSFRLPGESQQIDRILDAFAEIFVKQSIFAAPFKNKDAAFVLAFSAIILNTDRHSTRVRSKMALNDFMKINRGINAGEDLPDDFMEQIYDSILNRELIIDENGDEKETEKEKQKGRSIIIPLGNFGNLSLHIAPSPPSSPPSLPPFSSCSPPLYHHRTCGGLFPYLLSCLPTLPSPPSPAAPISPGEILDPLFDPTPSTPLEEEENEEEFLEEKKGGGEEAEEEEEEEERETEREKALAMLLPLGFDAEVVNGLLDIVDNDVDEALEMLAEQ